MKINRKVRVSNVFLFTAIPNAFVFVDSNSSISIDTRKLDKCPHELSFSQSLTLASAKILTFPPESRCINQSVDPAVALHCKIHTKCIRTRLGR